MIKIVGISKSFGKCVFSDVNFCVSDGSVAVIKGASGSGKTTLLNIIMGLVKPDSGEVLGVSEKKSAVFQEDRLLENMDYFSNMHLVCNKTEDELLEEFYKLLPGENPKKKIKDFSGGMKRRVCILRAMNVDSDVVFLDEPFKGLDKKTKDVAINYVLSNQKKRTLFLVTHDKNEIVAFRPEIQYLISGEE